MPAGLRAAVPAPGARVIATSRQSHAAPQLREIGDPVCFPRGVTARNRTVLAAMTNRQSYPDGTLSDDEIHFLLMRAAGGFGIVTTACAHVSADGQGFPGELGVFHDRHIPQLARLAAGL